jgi:uncharacterized membrane protein
MSINLRARWLNLLHTLWFVPSIVSAGYIALAAGLVRLDDSKHFRNAWVFGGDDQAARTVLSVIAGSLITVAGLTFSVTMIVLQLTSSQFSPRVVRNYLGDRIAQLTIGSFIGIFAYCLLALRSVGNVAGAAAAVPRLTVTVASALALVALVMLIVFIHHIAQLVQASELAARLGQQTLGAIERLYPQQFGSAASEDGDAAVAAWCREERPGVVSADRSGFVQSIDLRSLARGLADPQPRVHVRVAPGDFACVDEPLVEVWPCRLARELEAVVRRAISIGGERDIEQDAHFGIRQLTDIALRAISPSVNDPTTAATCIGYIRSALVRLATREFPPPLRRAAATAEPVVVRQRSFAEYVDAFAEIGRYAGGDARVAGDVLGALAAIGGAAASAGALDRVGATLAVAEAVAEQALDEVGSTRDRVLVETALQRVERAAATGA